MLTIYNSASVCILTVPIRCGLRLQPDLVTMMATNRNWDELKHIWSEWRRNTGQSMRETFEQLVHLSNEAARMNSKDIRRKFEIIQRRFLKCAISSLSPKRHCYASRLLHKAELIAFFHFQTSRIPQTTGISPTNLEISSRIWRTYGKR